MSNIFSGTGVALATPFKDDYSVDFDALEKLVNFTLDGGVDYLVVMGTTGESPVFTWEEKLNILSFISKCNQKRKPIVFGLGGNNTFDLIEKSKEVSDTEINAILSVSPYYNRPSQEGIVRHYNLLADASPKPVILYNVPSRTASNVSAESTLRLANHENIIGMKEASGDLNQCRTILKSKPSDFLLLSGDDQLTLDLIKSGANGVISVAANVLPSHFSQMVAYALEGNYSEAEKFDDQLTEAYTLLAAEGNPSSLKVGLSVLNICRETVKPPLFEGSEELKASWKNYLKSM